ncbi:hypothetical protein BDZ88DRAFT_420604 [Geranomyces variabilis]|nr:hypothetical protein BDZ88DRAFT_420604 [Geranomyces variabilis]KAJ3138988.1 Cholesterol 25-hydroxylase-like protein [Geranomyces variabilis]
MAYPQYLVVLAVTAGIDLFFATFSILHMLVLEQWTNYLYFTKKVLKRRSPVGSMTSTRRALIDNFADLSLALVAPMFALSRRLVPAVQRRGFYSGAIDYTFHPIDVALSVVGIYLCFDVWYYAVHRLLHENPFLYRTIHKVHHEDVPVHVFITFKGKYIENILAASPGLTLWVILTLRFAGHNFWALLLPALTLIMEFNTAHSGFLDHPLLYAMSPLQYIVKTLPTARPIAQEHEVHHLRVKKNYAPVFSFLDRLAGTHVPADLSKFATADVIETMHDDAKQGVKKAE